MATGTTFPTTVEIKIIPHSLQRYNTAGDWVFEQDKLVIYISDTGEWKYNMAVALHELAEVILCKANGVTQDAVDAYDMKSDSNDPGDEPDAPYHQEHQFATAIERTLIAALNLKWKPYQETLDSLQ